MNNRSLRLTFSPQLWLRSLCSFFLLVLLALPLAAQTSGSGSITGTVQHAQNKSFLEGAEVTLVGTGQRTLTARDGSFTFANVPAGVQQLQVFYTGLDIMESSVTVQAGTRATPLISVGSEVVQLDAFRVSASLEGEAASITRQRNAANVVNVVSTDAFGSVADGNIGNMMVRLPGVAGEFENGEVVGIKIRGTPVEFSALNVDGVRASGAFSGFNTQGDRGAQSDQIPAEFIKEVAVTKAPTPDMPADSIGGSTNLITKSALDFNEDVTTYRVGVNHNLHRDDRKRFTPNIATTHLTRVGANRQIGVAVSLSYTETEAPRDRVQVQRSEADARVTQARTLTNVNERIRGGLGLKFDYRFSDSSAVYLKFQSSYYHFDSDRLVYASSDSATRRVADYSVVSRAQILAGAVPRTSANLTASVAPGFTSTYSEMLNANWTFDGDNNVKTGRQYSVDFGGSTKLGGDQEILYQASFAPSTFVSNLRTFLYTLPGGGIGMSIDSTNPSRPIFRQTYGPSILFGQVDFTRYRAQMQQQPERGEEDVANVKADYIKRFVQLPNPVEVKAGGAWRQQYRSLSVERPNWNYVGPDKIQGNADDNLAQFIQSSRAYTVFNNAGNWPDLPAVNYQKAWATFNRSPELFSPVGTSVSAAPNYSDITEDVYAGYVQGQIQMGKLNVLGGIRFEHTDVDATGSYSDPQNPTVLRAARSARYDGTFPSLHFRYNLSRQLVARLSYSTGAARPNMTDLYPTTTVSYNSTTGLGTVSQSNPGLKPQEADNYDLSLEYYFEPAGLLSVSLFRKDIVDFFSRTSDEIDGGANNGFGGQYEGFILNTTTNQGEATIEGYELNYNQRLTMLPKPFNGLSLFANYTYLKTEGTYRDGAAELAGFVPKSGNAGLSFLWRNLETRFAWRYTGDQLRSYNTSVFSQNRFKATETIDINLQYRFSPRLAVYLDIINLQDEWPENYTGTDPNRITFSDSYGTRINMGISGRF